MRRRDLEKLVRWCRRELGLREWEIELYVSREPPEWVRGGEETVGATDDDLLHRVARIWIRKGKRDEMESTLVHEMLHVAFTEYDIPREGRPHMLLYNLEKMIHKLRKEVEVRDEKIRKLEGGE